MEIKKIFVVGGGFMGAGIAQTAICSGYEVALNDVSMEILGRSRAGIDKMLTKNVSKGKMTQEAKDAAMNRLKLADSLNAAADADLVIEAVIEKTEMKKAVFAQLSGICREDAILATNTSSISIAEIASVVKNPSRFLGMHFFSPVPLMKLLEIVKGIATASETIETAQAVGKQLGKVCIVAKDSPAFIVNRMLDPMINEAIGLLEAGIGSVEDIDVGMKNGLNHPMGPLELIDMAGIDIELAVMEVLYKESGDPKYRPVPLLRNMVRMGWLGRKTGKGFYVYNADGSRTVNLDL
jgi:3-hydroxybutyryl-CoA dehydrogenase